MKLGVFTVDVYLGAPFIILTMLVFFMELEASWWDDYCELIMFWITSPSSTLLLMVRLSLLRESFPPPLLCWFTASLIYIVVIMLTSPMLSPHSKRYRLSKVRSLV